MTEKPRMQVSDIVWPVEPFDLAVRIAGAGAVLLIVVGVGLCMYRVVGRILRATGPCF